ncbi:MAG: cation:proton antiporter subunit C [Eubacteriaceae bacterium]|nr:cation:proton antiporter subunit C [Eubacteriaceae bacterium]
MNLQSVWDARVQCAAVVLFAVGFSSLLLHRNLFKKIIGLNIMETASYLFLTATGYIRGRTAPIVTGSAAEAAKYVNPLPAGLVLTGIVVSVSFTAVMLSLMIRLYREYRTLDLDEIYELVHSDPKEGRA